MLTDEQYETFFHLLNDIVNNGEGSWKERRDLLLDKASDADMTNLLELIAWDLEAHTL